MKTKETIKNNIRKAINLSPDVEVIELNGLGVMRTYNSKKDFGLDVLTLLEDDKVENIQLTAVQSKGFLGWAVSGIESAINRNVFNNVHHLTYTISTK